VAEMVEDPSLLVLSIGPAGENLVRFASVMHRHRAAGRIGLGAVMGPRNSSPWPFEVRVSYRSPTPKPFARPPGGCTRRCCNIPWRRNSAGPGPWAVMPGAMPRGSAHEELAEQFLGKGGGDLPAFHGGESRGLQGMLPRVYAPVRTARRSRLGTVCHARHDGGEYESVAAFTAFVTNENVDAAVHASWLCNDLGVDTISAGGAAAFLMECAERGISLPEDARSLGLAWGNGAALAPLVRKIAFREGGGDLVADGVCRAAERLGRPEALAWAVAGKGLEGPAHDPRAERSLPSPTEPIRGECVTFIPWRRRPGMETSSISGYDASAFPIRRNFPLAGAGESLAARLLQDAGTLPEILCTCKFYMYAGVTLDDYAAMLAAATGWDVSGEGTARRRRERIFNPPAALQPREGFAAGDDALHPRIRAMPEFGRYADDPPLRRGGLRGNAPEYYAARGGIRRRESPKRRTLRRLTLPSDLTGA
jgi:aldehyde:ferredoxin oxidoreductase